MSHSNTGGILLHTLKTIIISLLRLAGLVIAFSFKIVAMVLHKISELLGKIVGHGTGH